MHPFASVNRGGEASPSVPGTRNQLTCQSLSPTMAEHSIKSGGGTGPTMPRQPVSRKARRPGANSRSEEEYSGEDGESVNLVTLATLGGMNDYFNPPGFMDKRSFFSHLRCRECGRHYQKEAVHVCEFDFGPLEAAYDYDAIGKSLTRDLILSRPQSMWRYRELLPIENEPTVGLQTGFTPL